MASHRRWHRPRSHEEQSLKSINKTSLTCTNCPADFKTKTALKIHKRECLKIDTKSEEQRIGAAEVLMSLATTLKANSTNQSILISQNGSVIEAA